MSLIRIPSEVVSPRRKIEKSTTSDGKPRGSLISKGGYTRVKVDGTVTILVYISPVLTYLLGTVPCILTMGYN